MFNIGSGEMILLFVVALMIFGPNRLPEMGRALGEAMHSFRHAMKSLSEPIVAEVQSQGRQIRESAQPATSTSATSEILETEPPVAETTSVTRVDEVEAPVEGPAPQDDEHVPVPMTTEPAA